MARKLALALAALEATGFLLIGIAAALFDARFAIAVAGVWIVIEAREAAKP